MIWNFLENTLSTVLFNFNKKSDFPVIANPDVNYETRP